MFRFFIYAIPLILLLLMLFSVTISALDVGPANSLTVLSLKNAPFRLVMATWLLEAFGLVGIYLLVAGRRPRWLDGLLAGWVAWIFRGPLLVVTIVVAAGQQQTSWFRLAVGWWVLYTICGLLMAVLDWRLAKSLLSRQQAMPASVPIIAGTEPFADKPAIKEAAITEPSITEPVSDEPVPDEPAADEPAPDESSADDLYIHAASQNGKT